MTTTQSRPDRNAELDAFLPLVASAWSQGELSDLSLQLSASRSSVTQT